MSDWLREKLSKTGVLETIEPYWISKFNEVCTMLAFLSVSGCLVAHTIRLIEMKNRWNLSLRKSHPSSVALLPTLSGYQIGADIC